jgi:TM2 domain-containing membrane protein YozV
LPAKKIPIVALLLSLFVPGLGQIYNETYRKAGIMMGLCVFAIILDVTVIGLIIGIPLMLGVWIWAMIDAHKTATRSVLAQSTSAVA